MLRDHAALACLRPPDPSTSARSTPDALDVTGAAQGAVPRPRARRINTMPEPQDDPFDVIGIEPTFDLDVDALKKTLRRRIASNHPDRASDPIAREEAVRLVARLNEARTLLEDDERRANLALIRLGGASASDDRSLPPTFLMEILEVREDMERALASNDADERARVQAWADNERARLHELVRSLFERLQGGDDCASEIRLQLNVWRYIERMIDQLHPEGLDPFAGPGDS